MGSMMNLTMALRRQQLGRGRLKWSNFPQNFFLSYLTKHGSDTENNREFHECIENILEILRVVDRDANSNSSECFEIPEPPGHYRILELHKIYIRNRRYWI